jgi:hypothetical protein
MEVIPAWLLVVLAAVGEAVFVFLVVWRLRAGRLRRGFNAAQGHDTGGSSAIEAALAGFLPLPLARYAAAELLLFGFYASMTKLQHLVEERGVRIRYGLLNEVFVPYAAITEIKVERVRATGMTEGLRVDREEDKRTSERG